MVMIRINVYRSYTTTTINMGTYIFSLASLVFLITWQAQCKKQGVITTLWLNLYFIRFVDFSGEKQTFELCNFKWIQMHV